MKKFSFSFLVTFLLIASFLSSTSVKSQDINYARKVMDTLSSPSMFGRGYINDGCALAADYIAGEMNKLALQSFIPGYKQQFGVNVKTYPSNLSFTINRKELIPGKEFIVMTGSPSVNGTFDIKLIDSTFFKNPKKIERLKKNSLSTTLLAFNKEILKGKNKLMADSLIKSNYLECAGFILLTKNSRMLLSVRPPVETFKQPVLTMLADRLPSGTKKALLEIELHDKKDYQVSNVIGFIPGTSQPDSFIVVTGHYDHLGMMGPDTYFPGANDNASGIAMILDLATHYSKEANRLPYSIAIMAFAGEELGLLGSLHYVENPYFDLKKIKFLINLDMVGTGSQGITMVNSLSFPKHYNTIAKINKDNQYLSAVKERGESCNSDHCPFYLKGVPAVFIYSMGPEHIEYHNVYDLPNRVPLTEYENIFRLTRDFINTF